MREEEEPCLEGGEGEERGKGGDEEEAERAGVGGGEGAVEGGG